ncbi:MAG TPA: sialidase family protein, partial [Ktedonobacterales bacterium]
MDSHDESFSSKRIDEQIEHLLKQQAQPAQPPTASARLIRQLRRIYRQQAPGQREQTLARAWERITQQATRRSQATSNHTEQRVSFHLSDLTTLYRETSQTAPDENRAKATFTSHKGTSTMNTKRVRGLTALVTLTVVVAVFVLLFTTILPKHTNKPTLGSSGTPKPKASATATTISLPAGQWTSTFTGNAQDGDAPMLFPGNTRILYQNQTANGDTTIRIRRSDDGGKTWHKLAAPGGLPSVFDSTSVFVSSLDPNVVFITLTLYQIPHPNLCQLTPTGSNALARLSGGPTCGVQYLSTDGGQHWSRLALPIAGALGAPYGGHFQNPTSEEILRPQGQRLYSTISNYSTVGNVTFGGASVRILASDDGGKTWKLVDADLRANSQNACDYAPTPTGSTIFAITETSGCYDPNDYTPASQFLWRSDDGGAHWSQVSQLPALAGDLALAFPQNG